MTYIKGGIVTRIEKTKGNKKQFNLENVFDLNLFERTQNSYLLKTDILKENLTQFREEFLSYTNFKGDSLNNCEAYCLGIKIDQLLKDEIVLIENNKKYYFKNHQNLKFETDIFYYQDEKISFIGYLIPIFWDINQIKSENFNIITYFVNNLTRKTLNNKLKGACWFSVI